MFYTRPDIEPLGWDLSELRPNGVFHFVGTTSDNCPVHIKYRNSWLQVWRGTVGASNAENIVLEKPIGPPFHRDLLVEQICDLLGITINGKKPVLTEEQRLEAAERKPILDWSGRTTYWESWHYLFDEDLELLLEEIKETFPDSILVQGAFTRVGRRYRKINFFIRSDDYIRIGIGGDAKNIENMLGKPNVSIRESAEVFKYCIDFDCIDSPPGRSDMGKALIEGYNKNNLKLDYRVICPRHFRLKTHYLTHDKTGQKFMEELLRIIKKHFFQNYQIVNLQTKSVLKICEESETNYRNSYSNRLKQWCLEKPNHYLSVGIEAPHMRAAGYAKMLGDGEETVFYGLRPL
jgi:hypothetical protein